MGISFQGDTRPRHQLLNRSQSWIPLWGQLALLVPLTRVYHRPTSSPLTLRVLLWSTKPHSDPKISPNCWNEELKTYAAFIWIRCPVGVFSTKRTELYPR